MRSETMPEAQDDEDNEGREQQSKKPDRVIAHFGRTAQVPRAAKNHDSQRPEVARASHR